MNAVGRISQAAKKRCEELMEIVIEIYHDPLHLLNNETTKLICVLISQKVFNKSGKKACFMGFEISFEIRPALVLMEELF